MSDFNSGGELKKYHMSLSTIVMMIFCLVAAGAYGIEEMIPMCGPGITLIILMIVPFIWGLPMGLVAAELGGARPQEGGYYKWVQEGLGEFWGFQSDWWRTCSCYVGNAEAVVLAGGYLGMAFHFSGVTTYVVEIIIILLLVGLNLRGIGEVGAVTKFFSIAVLAAFALIAVIGFMHWNQNPFSPLTPEGVGIGEAAASGLILGMWMYAGYEGMSTVAGEITNPKIIPKALMIAIPVIMFVYILPTMGGLASIGSWDLWSTGPEAPVGYHTVLTTYLGAGVGIVFLIISAGAQSSYCSAYIATSSRGFFVLAQDRLAPPLLVKLSKNRGVPYMPILIMGVIDIIMCQFEFKAIVVIDVFFFMSSYVMIYLAALKLRKKIPDSERTFKVPGGNVFFTILCVVPIVLAVCALFVNGADYFLGGMIGLMSGPVIYIIWKIRYGGMAKIDPQHYPLNQKTKLANGDLLRVGFMCALLAAAGIAAKFFLPIYEAGGEDYYTENYGIANMFDHIMNGITITVVLYAVAAIALFIIGRKIDPMRKRNGESS